VLKPPAVRSVHSGAINNDDSSAARDLGRVVVVYIRPGTQAVCAPLRGGAWLVERYQL
jgi:hypothetical protein